MDKELAYRNILEFLYASDGKYNNKSAWRADFLAVLRFNILDIPPKDPK